MLTVDSGPAVILIYIKYKILSLSTLTLTAIQKNKKANIFLGVKRLYPNTQEGTHAARRRLICSTYLITSQTAELGFAVGFAGVLGILFLLQ